MSDPFSNETTAQLIARKPGNLNILVAQREYFGPYDDDLSGHINRVVVRYNYQDLRIDGAVCGYGVPAPFGVPDLDGIEHAILALREVWGELPVQNNQFEGKES